MSIHPSVQPTIHLTGHGNEKHGKAADKVVNMRLEHIKIK